MNTKRIAGIFSMLIITMLLGACKGDGPGVEYMPDMYRSPAVEPYVDNDEYGNTNLKSVREPAVGTIPRGFKPHGLENSAEGYEMAGEKLSNPFEANESNLADGKQLFGYFCTHCHGAKGDGKGSLTHAVYGAVPSYSDTTPNRRGGRSMSELKAGHIYHTIVYGLNAMGPHASQITDEERWKIVLYVQSMQGKEENVNETAVADAQATN